MTLDSRFEEEKEAIKHNLDLMRNDSNDGMQSVILGESRKVASDIYGPHPFLAANFYYHPETGKIEYFTTGHHDSERARGLSNGMFVISTPIRGRDRIINFPHQEVNSSQARVVFYECARRYNTQSLPKETQKPKPEKKPESLLKRIAYCFGRKK